MSHACPLAAKEDIESLRCDMLEMGTSIRRDTKRDMKDLGTSLRSDMKDLDASLRRDMAIGFDTLRNDTKDDIRNLGVYFKDQFSLIKWMFGISVSLSTAIVFQLFFQ